MAREAKVNQLLRYLPFSDRSTYCGVFIDLPSLLAKDSKKVFTKTSRCKWHSGPNGRMEYLGNISNCIIGGIAATLQISQIDSALGQTRIRREASGQCACIQPGIKPIHHHHS